MAAVACARNCRPVFGMAQDTFNICMFAPALQHRVERFRVAVHAHTRCRVGGVLNLEWHVPDSVAVGAVAHTHPGVVPGMAIDAEHGDRVFGMAHITRNVRMSRVLSYKRLLDK